MIDNATRRRLGAGVFLLVSLVCVYTARAQNASLEYTVKGAYLYKFIPFIDWPAGVFSSPSSPVTLCLFGTDPFGAPLDRAIAGQNIGARRIAIRRIDTLDNIEQCQEIFVGRTDPQAEADLLHAAQGKPILTVTDSDAPPEQRGILSFVVDANHVLFDADDAKAAEGGLVISSKLLGLARSVKLRSAGP